jgi:hypothetical protein
VASRVCCEPEHRLVCGLDRGFLGQAKVAALRLARALYWCMPVARYVDVCIRKWWLASTVNVEQLSRYLDLMRRDTLLGTVHGILAAQLIKPQARVLANDRGISCVTVDYDMLRGLDSAEDRLF